MHIFYMLYLAIVTFLLATTMPESRGRWSGLYDDIVSMLSHTRSAVSAISLLYHFVTGTTSASADNSLSPVEGVGVCWQAPFGIHGTCHPLDYPITPTPTAVPDAPATRTVSAILASPIPFNPVSYKDIFAVQLKITKASRGPKQSKSTQPKILSEAAPARYLDLLDTTVSTMIVIRVLAILGKFIVGYPKSLRLITFIPDDLEFHPPADSLDECHALILSWVSTTSLLIRIDSIAPIHSDDRTNLNEFSLWVVYFSIVLVTSCPRSAVPPPPPLIESRAILRRPLMIKAPTSEAVGVSSCCGSQPYAGPGPSFGLDGSPEIRPLELKDKVNLPTPVLGLQSIIRSQAQCVVHTPGLPATNSLHPENCVDNLRSEITDPVRSEDPASPLLPGMPSTGTERSLLCHSPDVSGPTLIQSFERISGRRITPIIQLGYGQGDDASKIRSSLSLIKVVSMESIPLGSEGDFGLLLQFPAPPKKTPVRPYSLLKKVGTGGISFLRPSPSPTPDGTRCREPRFGGLASLTRKLKLGSSIHRKATSQRYPDEFAPYAQSDTETTSEEGSPVGNVRLPISLTLSRWNLQAKKGKRKLRQASSLFFTSPNPFNNLHEKVGAVSKNLPRWAFDKEKRFPEHLSPPPTTTGVHDIETIAPLSDLRFGHSSLVQSFPSGF